PVLCSSGLAADCASLPVPTAVESCYDVVGCAWSLGDWSSCSTTCGAGVRSRAVTCPSGWPADCASFEVEPASSESCRGRGCDWRLGEWSECSNDCGDGSKARTVRCSSGEDTDCVEAKPSNETRLGPNETPTPGGPAQRHGREGRPWSGATKGPARLGSCGGGV
ncbi:A disintegrin and metalloproteinase with thrombospondin motifs 12 (ADAM-TS 12) (ADAM-TS12) (ADAMTS-12), partial [Durusdinium trenchii]